MALGAGSEEVSGTKVAGATNVTGGSGGVNGAVAGLADDVASINAARANAYPKGTGSPTSVGRSYGQGAGGQTDGGY
jgi:hypothetical protein